MTNTPDTNTRLYLTAKWLWLLLQALILPLAAIHGASSRVHWPLSPPVVLLCLAGSVFLVLWLIAQSLLAMARFPLSAGGALLLVGGTIAQFVFLTVSKGSLLRAVYAVFFATLAALAVLVAVLTVVALRRRSGPPAVRLVALLAQLPAAGLVWFLMAPLRPAFSGMSLGRELLEWLVLAANSGLIIFSLHHFSIFARPAQNDAAYALEWERWAAPTIIILILSAAAAIVLVGVCAR